MEQGAVKVEEVVGSVLAEERTRDRRLHRRRHKPRESKPKHMRCLQVPVDEQLSSRIPANFQVETTPKALKVKGFRRARRNRRAGLNA